VALTRARKTLWVSASEWYGENVKARGPSEFFASLVEWAGETGEAWVTVGSDGDASRDAGHDAVDGARSDGEPAPNQNPMLGYRQALVRPWPGPARSDDADDAFPAGWRRAAAEAVSAGGIQASLLDALGDDRKAFERAALEQGQLAVHLREREAAEAASTEAVSPQTVGASDLITFAMCPKRFYWSRVRPLPRFSGPAARIGTEIHAWIERKARGQGQLLELDDRPDLTDEELAGDPGRIERLREAFLASRFSGRTPLFAERAFLLRLDGSTVGGRIDAIFGEPDGPWEVVDWKTGRRPAEDDPTLGLQLDIYGLACVEIWGKVAGDLTLTYAYLASGDEVSKPMDDPATVRSRVMTSLDAIAAGSFEPTPGPWCTHCDFRSFCDAGQAWLANPRLADQG
jgi:DNA helicase-2/ATP-dependent DNA helicase PcrA